MSTTTVRVYTDYRSPHAYLAMAGTYQLERDFNVRLDWYPYAIDLEAVYGAAATRSEREWRKVKYLYGDVRRQANERGLIVKGTRKVYEPTLANLAMLYAKRCGVLRAFQDPMLDQFWTHHMEIDNVHQLELCLQHAGLDPVGFRGYAAVLGLQELQQARIQAEQDGVFGAPSFVHEGELFWGPDRLDYLRRRLQQAGLRRVPVSVANEQAFAVGARA
jgi:2-hydroxychromene-2-carboxylate isomerase